MRTILPGNRATLGIVVAVATGLSLSSPDYLHGSGAHIVADSNMTQASHPVEKRSVQPGVCDREAEKLLDQKPVRIRGSVRAPKTIRDVRPKYPELPPGTTGSGMWMGEALINNSGKVVRVWPIREVEFKPPFPSFNSAITDAIRQWVFEPLILQGKAAPVCMTVTVNINWS
jgi:hypothetical protein